MIFIFQSSFGLTSLKVLTRRAQLQMKEKQQQEAEEKQNIPEEEKNNKDKPLKRMRKKGSDVDSKNEKPEQTAPEKERDDQPVKEGKGHLEKKEDKQPEEEGKEKNEDEQEKMKDEQPVEEEKSHPEKEDEQAEKKDEQTEVEKDEQPKKQPIAPKPKATRKAKAKANGRGRGRGRGRGQKRDQTGEQEEVTTPNNPTSFGERSPSQEIETTRKRLFEDPGEPQHTEAQKAARIQAIQDAMLPKEIKQTRQAIAEVTGAGDSAVTGKVSRGRGKGKKTEKGQKTSPNTKKVIQSPSIQKEKKRRARGSKKEEPKDLVETLEDQLLQGVFLQQLKAVDVLTFDDLKKHLLTHGNDLEHKRGVLSIYWGRTAVGIKWTEDPKTPQVAYFSFKAPDPKLVNYNHLMTLAYSAGTVLVSRKIYT